MVRQGARKLVFLTRTGASGSRAQKLISDLRSLDVNVQVVQGDVSNIQDVQHAVQACQNGPIKGVVHAALTLHVSGNLFSTSRAQVC